MIKGSVQEEDTAGVSICTQPAAAACFSCFWFFVILCTTALQPHLSMACCRQEYWGVLPRPAPGDFPDPGIEPRSPALREDSLLHPTHEHLNTQGKNKWYI